MSLDTEVAEAIGEKCDGPEPYWIVGRSASLGENACCRCGKLFSEVGRCVQDYQHCPPCRTEWEADKQASEPPLRYSTDLNAAFAAAERVGLLRCDDDDQHEIETSTWLIYSGEAEAWHVVRSVQPWAIEPVEPEIIGAAPTAAEAICRAILEVTGG